jgi:hypothetical protein
MIKYIFLSVIPGKVVGLKCDQKHEDKARISIDHAIKAIRPTVFPAMYSVSFIPVIYPENDAPGKKYRKAWWFSYR